MAPYSEFRLTGGLSLKAARDAIGDGELRVATDCEFNEIGTVQSRSSRTVLYEFGSEVNGEGDAILNGTRYRITKAGTSLYLDDTPIALGSLTADGKISVVSHNNYAYVTDGTTFKRASELGLEDVGFDTPSTAPTPVAAGSGGSFAAGDYKYVYTFYNGVAESNFSPEGSVTCVASDSVTLTVPVGPASTTARRIYRTDTNGEWFFRVGEIEDNTTTTFADPGGLPTEADATAASGDDVSNVKRENPNLEEPTGKPVPYTLSGRALTDYAASQVGQEVTMTNLGILADWNDHDPPPTDLRNIRYMTERMYGISDNSLRFTLISAPEHWSLYNEVLIGRQQGETLQAIEPLGNDMICYTDAGIWRFAIGGVDALQSQLERVQSPVGVVSQWAVADLMVGGGRPAGHVFLAYDGVYVFDGRQAVRISDKVEELFRTSSSHQHKFALSMMDSAVATSKADKVLISYAHGSDGNDRTLLIDFEDPSSPKFAVWQVGYTTLHRDMDGKVFGGTADGELCELFTDGSETLIWQVQTKRFPMNGTTALDKMERIILDADLAGLDTGVTVSVNKAGGNSEIVSFTLTGYDGRTKIRKLLPYYMRGDAVSVTLTSTGAGQRSLYSVAFGYDQESVD